MTFKENITEATAWRNQNHKETLNYSNSNGVKQR